MKLPNSIQPTRGFAKLLLILIPVILGLLVYLVYKGFDRQAWLVYSNSRYNFKVEFPPSWKLGMQEENNAGREIISPKGDAVCYAYGFENALNQNLNEFVTWLITDSEVISRSEIDFLGIRGIQIRIKAVDGKIQRAVYTFMSDTTGRGLLCTFPSQSIMEQYSAVVDRMQASFAATKASKFSNNHTACATLLNGSVVPLKDLQTFLDSVYTEVTITSREFWDQARLPGLVKELQAKNYTCYPMPHEMGTGSQEQDSQAVPAVKTVQWSCELQYNAYKYIQEDDAKAVADYQLQGYACEKEYCLDDSNNDGSVWLCTK
ncbi:hypothetical protein KKG63_02570 [Patescibacteria group bacterium]|nr:hypothetical protein [Patescibacteria group bacterium]